jgi:hypothetical protein
LNGLFCYARGNLENCQYVIIIVFPKLLSVINLNCFEKTMEISTNEKYLVCFSHFKNLTVEKILNFFQLSKKF